MGMLLLAALTACGCAWRQCCPDQNCGPASFDCQRVERQTISPDVSLIPLRNSVTFQDRIYCNLPEREAQCLAATNSVAAALLEQEAEAVAVQPHGLHGRRSSQCTQQIFHLQSIQERNRAAELALQFFLRLADAEAGSANVKLRLEELAKLLHDVQRLQEAGIDSAISQSTVESQQLELIHKQVDLEAAIEELNHQLANLLGAEPPPETRFWPETNLKVDPAVPNLEESQQLALMQRADLAALRLVADCDTEVMKTLLSQATAGLGLTLKSCQALSALHILAKHREENVRSEQIDTSIVKAERELRHEVARTISSLEARLVQIGLRRSRLDALQRQYNRLEKKRQVDAAAGFEARKARLDVLAAEQDLLHDVIEWKLTWVHLRGLQGELAIECGFSSVCE
jgi:hypothetical protein